MNVSRQTKVAALALSLAASGVTTAWADSTVKVTLWDKGPDSVMMDEAHMGGMGMGMGMKHMGDMPMAMLGITIDQAEVPAGKVTFEVTNTSDNMIHELIVAPVASADMVVPYNIEENAVDEEGLGDLGEVDDIEPGKSGALTLDLGPGTYLLYCNIPGHFANGMWVTLTVAG